MKDSRNKKQYTARSIDADASKGIQLNVYILDELEDLKRMYTSEQLQKMWKDAYPKLSKNEQE